MKKKCITNIKLRLAVGALLCTALCVPVGMAGSSVTARAAEDQAVLASEAKTVSVSIKADKSTISGKQYATITCTSKNIDKANIKRYHWNIYQGGASPVIRRTTTTPTFKFGSNDDPGVYQIECDIELKKSDADDDSDAYISNRVEIIKYPKKGDVIDARASYGYDIKVTNDNRNSLKASIVYTSKQWGKVEIPASINVGGFNYKITGVAKNAMNPAWLTIGGSFSTIPAGTFQKMSNLQTVLIKSPVKYIGKYAFEGNKALWRVTINSNVTTVGTGAFANCPKLTYITLPASVNKIGSSSFSGCKKLKWLGIKSTKLTSKNVNKTAFKDITSYTTIKVPKSKLSAYRTLFRKCGLAKNVKVIAY